MAHPVIMPRQGQSVESCVITKWHVRPGDSVKTGDALFSYETDKAAFDEESKYDGVILGIYYEEGDDVPVLSTVCAIGAPGEVYGEANREKTPDITRPREEVINKANNAPPREGQGAEEKGVNDKNIKISPRAKALAERTGALVERARASGPEKRVIERDVRALIDQGLMATAAARFERHDSVTGTGLGGRITLSDTTRAAETPPAAEAGYWEEPLSNMRKRIARAMTASLSNMAQLTHHMSFDASEIMSLRKKFKERGAETGMDKVTINDMALFAAARCLARPAHRALNAHLIDDKMRYFTGVHLGIAVDTERGLMVPTLFDADKLSLKGLSDAVKELAAECQSGTINPDLLRGGSFTVSNLGALGVEFFTPVINPPQTGILGVCAVTAGIREQGGTLVSYPKMGLSLTYDHRALDGAPASRFLRELADSLENFTLMLIGD